MSYPKLLEGEVEDPRVVRLEDEIMRLRRQLADAENYENKARQQAGQAMSALRKTLAPLYRALQAVFGELDAAGVEDSAPTSSVDPRWQSWKNKLPGRPAEMIDLLLLHGEMNRNQLMAAMHAGKDVVRITISKLNVAGLLVKNGGRVSLKQS